MKVTRTTVAIGLAVLASISGCQPQSDAPITFAASKNIWSTLLIIAREKGFAKEEHLDLEISYVQAAKFAMDALVANSTDLALVVEVNVAFLGFTGNTSIGLIGTVVEAHDGAVVARRDARIANPGDLRGKSLGILQGTTSQIFAERFLQKYSIQVEEVRISNLQPIAMQTAMVANGVDAASIWEPFIHNLEGALGSNAIVFRDRDVYTGYMNVAIRKDWGAKNPETAKAVLRALRKAERFVHDHPEEAQEIIAKEINLDLATTKAIWKLYNFELTLKPAILVGAIQEEAAWIKKTQPGFADKTVPVYDSYIAQEYFQAIGGTP